MKNRFIILDNSRERMLICLSESDGLIAKNKDNAIIVSTLDSSTSFVLKTFLDSETDIKDAFYDRLCHYIMCGDIYITDKYKEAHYIDTFDVNKQIEETKKFLNK